MMKSEPQFEDEMMINIESMKGDFSDYTEKELVSILNEFYPERVSGKSLRGSQLEKYLDTILDFLIELVGTREVGDFIYYPTTPENDSPVGALNRIIRWRKSQGLPLCKDSETES
ncbi:bacteriocin immunity protein [Kluyvera intermedia]|uniref:bacteriocin immunity protein n=1 Tax=Kluyvera intermedia TaxID=61648 RepID=UPI00352404C5